MINCRLDDSFLDDSYDDYDDYDDEDEDEEIEGSFVAEDELLSLLVQLRAQLIQGDYRSLYAVWEKYGYGDADEENEKPPIPAERADGKGIIEHFLDLLD